MRGRYTFGIVRKIFLESKRHPTSREEIINSLKKALAKESSLKLSYDEDYDLTASEFIILAEALKDNTTLTTLMLPAGGFKDEIAKTLENNRSLTKLKILMSNGLITNKALDSLIVALTRNPNLTRLELVEENNPNMITKLASLLENNQSSLSDLCYNKYDYKRVSLKALFMALGKNKTLEKLKLYLNVINDKDTPVLANALKQHPNLTHLSIENTHRYDAPEDGITTEGAKLLFDALKINKKITHFSYAYNNLSSFGGSSLLVPFLKENQTLTYLNLSGNHMDHTDISILAKAFKENTSVVDLNLSGNKLDTRCAKALSDFIKDNNTLTSLDLGYCDIKKEGMEALAKSLAENKSLTKLNLESDVFTSKIKGQSLEILVSALEKNQSLTDLGLRFNEMIDIDLPSLVKLLKNTKLKKIDLSDHSLSYSGIQQLVTHLETNQSLTSLSLESRIMHNYIDIEGIRALTKALKKNSSLTELALGFALGRERDNTYKAIEELLQANVRLTSLNIPDIENHDDPLYDNTIKALERNQDAANKERIALLREEIKVTIPNIPGVLAGIIADYAGGPPRSQPRIAPSKPEVEKLPPLPITTSSSSNWLASLSYEEQIALAIQLSLSEKSACSTTKKEVQDVTHSASPEISSPLTPMVRAQEPTPESLPTTSQFPPSAPLPDTNKSIFAKFATWLRRQWSKFFIFIHNVSNNFKNKWHSKPKTAETRDHNIAHSTPPPNQAPATSKAENETLSDREKHPRDQTTSQAPAVPSNELKKSKPK